MQQTPVFHWGENFSNKFDLSNFKTVLDVGCRKGDLSAYLATRYNEQSFTAIDNIVSEVEQAREHRLSNLVFEFADALSLGCTENFDAAVSFSCLHWIRNKSEALQNIYQALKPGGKAFLQFFSLHGRLKNDRFIYQTAQSLKWKQYFKGFLPTYSEVTLSEFSHLLQRAGFIIHRIEFVRHKTVFEHPELLRQWLGTWASHVNRIPKQKQGHFLDETLQSYLNFHHYPDHGSFPYYEYLLEVVCEKLEDPSALAQHGIDQKTLFGLTKREEEILKQYLHGKTAKQIAMFYSVSAKTVEFHLANIKKKLNCHRRSDIYQIAKIQGFIEHLF